MSVLLKKYATSIDVLEILHLARKMRIVFLMNFAMMNVARIADLAINVQKESIAVDMDARINRVVIV